MHRLAVARVRASDHELVDEFVDGRGFGNVLGARAVVGEKDDQRVVGQAIALERSENAADSLVHPVDLRRVHFHATKEPLLVLGIAPLRLGRIAIGELHIPSRRSELTSLSSRSWRSLSHPLSHRRCIGHVSVGFLRLDATCHLPLM